MARVLVVDDDLASGHLIAKYLQRAGYAVLTRPDGWTGLEQAIADPPDIILLDVMMPGMDGLAVCKVLRENESTRDVPVLFLSARGDVGDRVAGLDRGATDYLVKPFNPDELLARVRASIRTKTLQDSLRRANADLRTLGRSRQELVSMLAHDIRGMLAAVSGAIDMARLDLEDVPPRDAHRFLQIAERNTVELVELTTNLLDCYRLDEGRLKARRQPVDLVEVADDVVERLAGQAAHRGVTVEVRGHRFVCALGDGDLLRRVLLNLVSNALKFSPRGGRIVVELGADLELPSGLGGVVVAVHDQGDGLTAEEQARLFERFSPLAAPSDQRPVGSGLGLAFCRGVVELMGGEIWVESEPGRGSTFAFALPPCPAADRA